MTRDASAQAVHERLEHLVVSMPEHDVEAGWAVLVAQLQPPIAPVVPLRRPRPFKAIVLGVAAAILIGGSALAMVGHGAEQAPPSAPSDTGSTGGVTGPHNHAPFSGAPPTHEPTSHHHGGGGTGSGHASDGSHGHDGTGSGGTSTPTSEPSTPPQQEPSPAPDPGTGTGDQGDNSQGDNSQGDNSQSGSSGGSSSGGSSGGGSGSGGSSGGDQGSNGQ
jgi:hypothetical protein